MINELKIIQEIKNTKGTNNKISMLSEYKNNKKLLDILNLVYNPTISTNIAEKKIHKDVQKNSIIVNDIIDFLLNECTGKDSDIAIVQNFINQFDENYKQLIIEICCQTLTIGMDYKNINKAVGFNLINIIEPMLAYPLDKRLKYINETSIFSATIKLDGFRCLIKYTDDNIEAFSRNGLKMEGMNDFLLNIKDSLPLSNCIYDGEILPQQIFDKSSDGYKIISKILRKKGEKNKDEICFHCFDVVIDDVKYKDRKLIVDKIKENKYIKIVQSLGLYSISDEKLHTVFNSVIDNGYEGLMLNNLDYPYEQKRSNGILKMKKFHTLDLKCIGLDEGQGNFKGMLGSIFVKYKNNIVRVGSGFSAEQRELFWNNKDLILNKIIEIGYFEETKNQFNEFSLRFPTFKTIRLDKNTESYN